MDERMNLLSGQYSSLFTIPKLYSVVVLFFNLRPSCFFLLQFVVCVDAVKLILNGYIAWLINDCYYTANGRNTNT